MEEEVGEEWRGGPEMHKEAGSPLFGRIWAYEELKEVDRPSKRRRERELWHKNFIRPDNWPADTEVEQGSWVFWLPEGWAQGLRTQVESGKKLSCYMSPQGKRFWHKKDVEKFVGRELPKEQPLPTRTVIDESGEKVKHTRYVTDSDAIPNWPGEDNDEAEWLPKDWKLVFRQLPSGLHRCHVPPGMEEVGFLYHRADVMKWLSGELTTVAEFGTSRPIASTSTPGPAKKRKKAGPPTFADFSECRGMRVAVLEGSPSKFGEALQSAGGSRSIAQITGDAEKIRQALEARGFEEPVILYVSFDQGDAEHKMAKHLTGFYFRRAEAWNERGAYQLVSVSPDGAASLVCGRLYLCWVSDCVPGGCWKLGSLGDSLTGAFALCTDESMKSQWLLPKLPPAE